MTERVVATTKAPEAKQKCSNSCKQNVGFNSSGSPADRILQLQRTAGNQAVQKLVKSGALQAKLRIGQPNDVYEQEADRVAEQVMRMPEPQVSNEMKISKKTAANPIQRKCPGCKLKDDKEEKILQSKGISGSTPEVPSELESSISEVRGGGQPLPESTRAFFEPRFGYNFSQVHVHSNRKAAEAARSVNARAFTLGTDMVFGAGEYEPHMPRGKQLIAHELTHVIQQNGENKTAQRSEFTLEKPRDIFESRREPIINKVEYRSSEFLSITSTQLIQRQTEPVTENSNSEKPGFFKSMWKGAKQAVSSTLGTIRSAGETISEGAREATKAMQIVLSAAVNPSRLISIMAEIAWERIPDTFKGVLIDKILDICHELVKVMPGSISLSIWELIRHGLIGFLQRAKSYPSRFKINIANRFIKLWARPSWDFTIGYLKGLLLGLWDGISGPFILLWDLLKLEYWIIEKEIQAVKVLLSPVRSEMAQELQKIYRKIESNLARAITELMSGKSNPLKIIAWINDAINLVLKKAEEAGAAASDALLMFLNKPDKQLGEAGGRVAGNVFFEVLLLVLTSGAYTAVKGSLKGVSWITKAVKWGAEIWEALSPLRSIFTKFAAFLRNNKALSNIVEAIEELFNLLLKYLQFSYGVSSAEGRGAKAAERGIAETGEGIAGSLERKVRVADTATHETHEITRLADGALIRCSDRCAKLVDSFIERSTRLSKTTGEVGKESNRLIGQAEELSSESRQLKEATGLSEAERASKEAELLKRAESLERAMAELEQKTLMKLKDDSSNAIVRVKKLLEENPKLKGKLGKIRRTKKEWDKASKLAAEELKPEMREFVENEFKRLENEALELEAKYGGLKNVNKIPWDIGENITIPIKGKSRAQIISIDDANITLLVKSKSKSSDIIETMRRDKFDKWVAKGDVIRWSLERQRLMRNRPPYRQGVVEEVWNIEKSRNGGRVFDPDGKELFWDPTKNRWDQWHMGHRPGKEYHKMVDEYVEGEISWEEFIEKYNDPENYRPEVPSINMGHERELK